MCKVVRKEVRRTVIFADDDKMVTDSIDRKVNGVVEYFMTKGITLSTAESCTGGMLSMMITSVAGASKVFLGGVCSYTEQMKMNVLGVSESTLENYTVYSTQVASQMSLGVMRLTGSDASVGITGLAGPDGGTDDKPIGTVYVSVRYKNLETVKDLRLYDDYEKLDRTKIRTLTTIKALEMLRELCENMKVEDVKNVNG